MKEIKIPKSLHSSYKYNQRRKLSSKNLQDINELTWTKASKKLRVDIPGLFIYLSHARRVRMIKDIKIT